MYGLEGILGNLVTSVATPAIGGLAGDLAGKAIEDELLKEITQTTVGALSGAAVGAGVGALTGGGKTGALSGALTGGIGGGVGGYNAPQISGIFNPPQSVGAPQGSNVVPQASPMPPVSNAQMMQRDPTLAAISPKQSPAQLNAVRSGMPPAMPQSPIQNFQAPTPQAPPAQTPAQPSAFKGYANFLKKNYEPLAGGFFLGSSIGAAQDTKEQEKERSQHQALLDLLDTQKSQRFARSIFGYADGGPVEVGLANPQISVHFPAWAQEQIQREGGLAALQQGMKQGMAQGGYINTQPLSPDPYPQSQIPRAQPYAAATPQRHEVVQMARGGLLQGDGDGMSDSIPANISGKEPVKVADGEYLIPREIAHKYGPEKLKAAMTKIRAAAHAKKGQQVKQDAGKRALIRTLGGVKA